MDALDPITSAILDASARGDRLDPAALTLLLQRYCASGRSDLGEVLGRTLAESFAAAAAEPGVSVRAAWLTLFAEVRQVSDDERVHEAALDLISGFRRAWPSSADVADAVASVDACLRAADAADPCDLVPAAIDELERIVGLAYRPGEGVARSAMAGQPRIPGRPADQVRAASALLTAFEATGRLPYSMLAEELMRGLPRNWSSGADLPLVCEAARVLGRLAALHDDADYRAAAVVVSEANYRRDAEALLAPLAPATTSESAAYALARLALR